MFDLLARLIIFVLGLGLVAFTVLSAIRTFVLPRSARDPISAALFRALRVLFNVALRRAQTYRERDRILAFYAPMGLLLLLPTWLILVALGYMGLYWATGMTIWTEDFVVSGSSLLTLGFTQGDTLIQTLLAFSEATIGLILVALLIAYLPTMYSAFSRRELAVTLLEVRAGSPPSAVEMLLRFQRLQRLDQLHDLWDTWETWFAEIEESHTSLAALVFFRSPQPDHSWVTASGAVLDAAALTVSTLDLPRDPQAELCLRAGYLALRSIARFFRMTYDEHPAFPEHPISITREEFDDAYEKLASRGVPVKPDRGQAWRDFAGWRVNYDTVLLALCSLTMAPPAPWSSDRADVGTIPEFEARR